MKKSLFFAAALLTLAACTREMDVKTPAGEMTITARTETSADTRTVVDGETHVYWEPGDEIKVFSGGNSAKFTTEITTSSATAEFKGTLNADDGADIWAVYPYSQDAIFSGETITTVLPSEQVARSGSFGKDMNLAIAHSTSSTLQFFNVGGGVRFSLFQEGITDVVLEGLKGEALAGKVKVGFQDGKPVIQEVTEGKTSITITPPEGESFNKNAWYYIVAIPGTLENGFKMTFHKTGTQEIRIFDKAVIIKRGVFGSLLRVDKDPGTSYPVPEAIDLGLPSGLKWASFNLGASKPEEYGEYFAWGETEPKDSYTWSNYKWCIDGNDHAITKYCTDPRYGYNGFTDGEAILNPEDDAAHVNLGGKWRIPTEWEWAELLNCCSSQWTTENGVYGCLFTSKDTGNSIFLPAAGTMLNSSIYSAESYCFYWSSSLDTSESSDSAIAMYYSSEEMGTDDASRYGGPTIRAVYGDITDCLVQDITLDKTELELFVGESATLTASVFPENATDQSVVWSSSDDAIATVSSTGVVTGVAAGSAFVEVTSVNRGLAAKCQVTVKERSFPVPEAIDLGLSVKWASFNLGASEPEEYGYYYAWGETEPYYDKWDPLIWKEGFESGYAWSSYKWCMGNPQLLTKYCTDPSSGYYGFTDDKTILDPEDDAAYVNLGEKWRIPTYDQWAELLEECTWQWTQENGVNGWRVTSNLNGNIIFLPATGFFDHAKLLYDSSDICYWSSSLCADNADGLSDAWCVGGESNGVGWEGISRCKGVPVRPVYDQSNGEVFIQTNSTAQTWEAETDSVYGVGFSATAEGMKLGYYKYMSNTDPVAPKETHVRIYKNAVLSICAPEGKIIKRLIFGCSPNAGSIGYCHDMTILEGDGIGAVADETSLSVMWTGSSSKVVLQASNAQIRIENLTVIFE